MIKNVIFDCGQVLVHFEPEYMVRQYVSNEPDVALLTEVIFDRLYWDKLDKGTISNEEVLNACHTRLPKRLWELCDEIYYNWIYNIPEIEGMSDLIKYIKKEFGVKTYLLSNISEYFAEHKDEIEILSLLDGFVFSSAINEVKPNKAIYEYLLSTFELKANECLFIDDRAENIEAGKSACIDGYVFDGDVNALKEFLDRVLK
jgi:putative hydrolase of the HAD superfamily